VSPEPAHQAFANLSKQGETAKAAKAFTGRFGPVLWRGYYDLDYRSAGQSDGQDLAEASMVLRWRLPLARLWREQRRFRFLFRLAVVMTPKNAGVEAGWSRRTPPRWDSRAEVLKLLTENLEAFPEVARRFIAIARSEDTFEPRGEPAERMEKDVEDVAVARRWLEDLAKDVAQSRGSWPDAEYLTWLTAADGVLEILKAARERCLRSSFDGQGGWTTKIECDSVIDALYFLLAQSLLGGDTYRFCKQCDGIYGENQLDEDTETCGPRCAERLDKHQQALKRRAEQRKARGRPSRREAAARALMACPSSAPGLEGG
jgi:hypothetical protein